MPVLHSRHLHLRDGHPLSRCLGLQTCWISKRTGLCAQVEWSLWRVVIHRKLLSGTDSYNVLPILLPLIATLYVIIYFKLEAQTIPGEHYVVSAVEQQRVKRERNVLNMAIAIVSGFVVCWVAFSIIIILYYFAWPKSFACGMYYISAIAIFLSRANCAINPCVCFIFSGNYRQGLKSHFSFLSTVQPAPNQVNLQLET